MKSVRHTISGTVLIAALLTIRPSSLPSHEGASNGTKVAVAAGGSGSMPSSMGQAESVPTFVIPHEGSEIRFHVKASVAIDGTFDKWDATLNFASTDPKSGVLKVEIQAASVDTGSNMKDGKLKGKDFFDVKNEPLITFVSNSIVQDGSATYDVPGQFTIRGITKAETLHLAVSGQGTGSGEIKGTMAFDRKNYGMNSGIPFVRIADRVEVDVNLKVNRVSGPPLAFIAGH